MLDAAARQNFGWQLSSPPQSEAQPVHSASLSRLIARTHPSPSESFSLVAPTTSSSPPTAVISSRPTAVTVHAPCAVCTDAASVCFRVHFLKVADSPQHSQPAASWLSAHSRDIPA